MIRKIIMLIFPVYKEHLPVYFKRYGIFGIPNTSLNTLCSDLSTQMRRRVCAFGVCRCDKVYVYWRTLKT